MSKKNNKKKGINVLKNIFTSKAFTNYILPLLLIIIIAIISTNIRSYPSDLPITEQWAKSTISSNLEQQVRSRIESENPLLPKQNKEMMVKEQMGKFFDQNSGELEKQVDKLAQNYKKEFKNDNGQTYLLAIDPYYYYRFYENMIETGTPGEYDKDGKSYTDDMLAPTETDVTHLKNDFHIVSSLTAYKIANFFNNNLTPLNVFFYIPVLFAILSVIPAFLIGKELGGNIGGIMTSTYILFHNSLISRTVAGFSDTDIYNVLFPLLIAYFSIMALKFLVKYFDSIKTKKNIIISMIFTLLSALSIALYSTAWGGWWYMLYFVLGYFGLFMLIIIIKPLLSKKYKFLKENSKIVKKKIIGSVSIFGLLLITASSFLYIFGKGFFVIFEKMFSFLSVSGLQNAVKNQLWPNVFTTVAELNPGSINKIISAIGNNSMNAGKIFIFFIFLGLAMIIFKEFLTNERIKDFFKNGIKLKKDKKDFNHFIYGIATAVFLAVWILATSYATLKGIRFMFMIIIPAGIIFGAFFGLGINLLSEICKEYLKVSYKATYIFLIVLLLLITIGTQPVLSVGFDGIFVDRARKVALNEVPSMNDDWHSALTKIKNQSEKDAIISSWWDFGHQFITVADRGATADGAHQNRPQSHWLGKLFLSDDLRESAGILRMLNCDSNGAYEQVYELTNDSLYSKNIVDKLVNLDKEEAENLLQKENPLKNNVSDIIQSTHCSAPESFVITSEDMGCMQRGNSCNGKTSVWAHFGLWNFTKAKIWEIVNKNSENKAIEKLIEEGYVNEREAEPLYLKLNNMNQEQGNSWIAGWPGYMTPMTSCKSKGNKTLECGNGAIIDNSGNVPEVTVRTQRGNTEPNSIVYLEKEGNNTEYKVINKDEDSQISVIIKGKNIMYASPVVAESMFTRLFYLDDGGRYFNEFDDRTDITGLNIKTWKVDWDTVN
ncbi:MAG: STT3 domain-containing protein [Nanobdellota archaeon]